MRSVVQKYRTRIAAPFSIFNSFAGGLIGSCQDRYRANVLGRGMTKVFRFFSHSWKKILRFSTFFQESFIPTHHPQAILYIYFLSLYTCRVRYARSCYAKPTYYIVIILIDRLIKLQIISILIVASSWSPLCAPSLGFLSCGSRSFYLFFLGFRRRVISWKLSGGFIDTYILNILPYDHNCSSPALTVLVIRLTSISRID